MQEQAMQRRQAAWEPEAQSIGRAVAGPRHAELSALSAALNAKAAQRMPAQNRTGLPDRLKAGVEALSGVSMDGVRVHRNSDKPAQLGALAYAQGRDIHLAPGQEKHLPHEAWHIAQQAQGRVKPTMQMKGVSINDDARLEREATAMGAKSLAALRGAEPNETLHAKVDRREPASQGAPIQAVNGAGATANTRKVSNTQASNMRASLVRVYGGVARQYRIDQDSGSTFNDNNNRDTTGHHNVKVTDTNDGAVYYCDFHNNGKYYTRG